MTLEEEIAKLDLIASDAFEGGDSHEFRQLAEWLRELELYRETLIGRPCEVCKFHKTGSCSRWKCVFEEVSADKGVLEKINEKQDSLRATCKAWDEAIQKDGYVD